MLPLSPIVALLALSIRAINAAALITGQPYQLTALCLHGASCCNKTVSFALFDPEPKAPTHTVCEASWPANAPLWPTRWMRVSLGSGAVVLGWKLMRGQCKDPSIAWRFQNVQALKFTIEAEHTFKDTE
jgi:hypothetical protein